ncbi:MAG TPA: hypothetical protein P5560_12770 [Thermotogota bacterium]|nr:hypothetical protein [Thermotogota bacterium]
MKKTILLLVLVGFSWSLVFGVILGKPQLSVLFFRGELSQGLRGMGERFYARIVTELGEKNRVWVYDRTETFEQALEMWKMEGVVTEGVSGAQMANSPYAVKASIFEQDSSSFLFQVQLFYFPNSRYIFTFDRSVPFRSQTDPGFEKACWDMVHDLVSSSIERVVRYLSLPLKNENPPDRDIHIFAHPRPVKAGERITFSVSTPFPHVYYFNVWEDDSLHYVFREALSVSFTTSLADPGVPSREKMVVIGTDGAFNEETLGRVESWEDLGELLEKLGPETWQVNFVEFSILP